jgi:chemotaxis family two-component system sensor kinase Cph1
MSELIEGLLTFSRTSRAELEIALQDVNVPLQEALQELSEDMAGRKIEWKIAPLPKAMIDRVLFKQVWINLLSNAIKYTRQRELAVIEIGCRQENAEFVFFVKDNGAGFDMEYADKLFGAFQRLHRDEEFEGIGIGLANVRRIITRHGGRTWGEGIKDQGATFYFTLPVSKA